MKAIFSYSVSKCGGRRNKPQESVVFLFLPLLFLLNEWRLKDEPAAPLIRN